MMRTLGRDGTRQAETDFVFDRAYYTRLAASPLNHSVTRETHWGQGCFLVAAHENPGIHREPHPAVSQVSEPSVHDDSLPHSTGRV